MAGILLAVLPVIGKILRFILIAGSIFLALLLFYPFAYRVDLNKNEESISIQARIHWLLHLLRIDLAFTKTNEKTEIRPDIRLAGIPLLPLINRILHRKKRSGKEKEREIRKEAPKKPTVPPGQRISDTARNDEIQPKIEVIHARRSRLMHRVVARIAAWIGKVKQLFRKIRGGCGILSEWFTYLSSESFARAKDVLFREGGAIIRHILPRKISGNVRFGTNDPANTGMILGIVSVFYPVLPETLNVEADFLDPCLLADLRCSGRVILIVLIVHAVRILICKDVRLLISRIRGKNRKDQSMSKSGRSRGGKGKTWRKTKKTMHFRTT